MLQSRFNYDGREPLPFVDEAKPLAQDFLLRIRCRGLKFPLSETSNFEKRLILANSEFFHYHLDYDTYLEYIQISDRSENIAPLRLVPPDFWSPQPSPTNIHDGSKAEDKTQEKHVETRSQSEVSRRGSWIRGNWQQRAAEKDAKSLVKFYQDVAARPQPQQETIALTSGVHSHIEAVDSGTLNPPAWMIEAKTLAQDFLDDLRRREGEMRADMASDFERRLLKANKRLADGKLLGYRYDNVAKQIYIFARKEVRVAQLKMVPPTVETHEGVDPSGTDQDEETEQESLEDVQEHENKVEEKNPEKLEEKNQEKKESNGRLPFMVQKVAHPDLKTPPNPPLRFGQSTLVEQMITLQSERGAVAKRAPRIDLQTSHPLVEQMIGKKFLCNLHDFEDLHNLSVNVLRDPLFKLPIYLYGIVFKQEKQDHLKMLMSYLAEMKTLLPAVCLKADNDRAVVDVIIETRAEEKVFLTDYLVHDGSADRVKTGSEKRPSVDQLVKFAEEEEACKKQRR